MTDSLLLRSQKNEVFLAIQQIGLEPSTFTWQDWRSSHVKDLTVSRLLHVPTDGYFLFDLLKGEHWCRYSPGEDKAMEENYPGSWPMQMSYVRNWLANVKRESGAVDLWETIAADRALGGSTSNQALEANAPFADDERQRIARSLGEIRAFIASTVTLEQQSLASVNERLDYLIEASERLGRKDWLNVAFSVVANIAVGAAFAPDVARQLLHLAGAVFSWVAGGSPLLPHPLH